MAHEDILLGVRDGTQVYASHRIDVQTTDDIRVDDDGAPRFAELGAVKSPPSDNPGHSAKPGYHRKVLVENVATRNQVATYLDSAGIGYTVEALAPTAAEQDAIEDWGAKTGVEAVGALVWGEAVADLDAGVLSVAEYARGENPVKGTTFNPPKGRDPPR